ncbi:MAG TPA: ChaN family lipoprotein, partial [Chromatiaceae bacterium]|nr:ChaN family lipoprotein [Chromatiaceae bacterium]
HHLFFADVMLRDEGMAERAARYLQDHPGKQMVILAGSGHLEYGQGIPQRLQRRLPLSAAIVLNGGMRDLDPQAADFLLYPRRVELAATGRLGVMLDTEARGPGVAVQGFSDNSGAAVAGMKEGDRIVRVGGKGIEVYADIRVALMDSRPGQKLPVEVERGPAGAAERLTLEVELH